jgi:MFS family permease
MGIFGASSAEEEELRLAQRHNSHSSASASNTDLSAYETAEEDLASREVASFSDDATVKQNVFDHVHESFAQPATPAHNSDQPESPHPEPSVHAAVVNGDSLDHPKYQSDSEDDPIPFHRDDAEDENALNRRYTLERIQSGRSIEEAVAFELRRSVSRTADSEATEHSNSDLVHKTSQTQHPREIAVADLDWESPSDPANPANWAPWKKWFITATVAIVCLCCSLGSSLFVSGVPDMIIHFGISQELCLSGLSFYLLGLAFGPMLTAPLSETIGRRWIYITSFPISMLFTMGVGLSKNVETLLILRFLTGTFASPALSIAAGTISDVWARDPVDMSFSVALFCLAPFLGPVIGPVVGGFAAEYKNWQWSAAWVSLMFSGAVLPLLLLVPETYKPIILARRAKARGIHVVRPPVTKEFVKTTLKFILFRPIEMLIVEPIVAIMSIYIAFIFAVLFGFFEAFPIIFRGVYHMDAGVSGLPFIAVGIGLILAVLFYIVMDKLVYFPKNADGTRGKRDENGNFVWDAPERKLFLGKVGAVCLPISLFWLGWTGKRSVHWIAPTLAGVPFGFGLVLVFLAVVNYFAMAFPPMSVASAMAANNLLRYILAAAFPLFTIQMYEKLHIGWASSLFGFIALAMVPVPWVFEIYGPGFRARSKFGYHAYFKKLAEDKAAKEAAAGSNASPVAEKHDTTDASPSSGASVSAEATEEFENEEVAANKV